MAKKAILNGILFQTVWFICLLSGSLWAVLATAVYLVLHQRFFIKNTKEWRLILLFLALGLLVDGSLFRWSVFTSETDVWTVQGIPPLWLLCLWISVATLFAHSLVFLQQRYWLAAVFGLVGPTMSYFAGANMAGVSLAQPVWQSLLLVAFIWAMILPLGVWLTHKWQLTEKRE